MTAEKIISKLNKFSSKKRALSSATFFKTGPGQYGEGDVFIGISNKDQRIVAKEFIEVPLKEIEILLKSKIHEHRQTALFILVYKFERSDDALREKIFKFYFKNIKRVNNWDLVDATAYQIVGEFLLSRDRSVLYKLIKSKNMWERRVAVVSTFAFIKRGDFKDILKFAEELLGDKEDLMHKAVGWMLREVYKKDEKTLVNFLKKNVSKLPRTTLRYAIERMEEKERTLYLKRL